MQLFYNPELNPNMSHFTFSQEESKHIVKVLRKQKEDMLHITNGSGYWFESRIIAADPKKCGVVIISALKKPERPYKLHIAVAPTKMMDRLEWFLEKATEIGINEITPIFCENSERRAVKQDRLEKVVQAAMKQSLQTYLPKINSAVAFKDFMTSSHQGDCFIAHCKEGDKTSLKSRLTPQKEVTILVGPEGDFSILEIELALKKGFVPVTLGENRLRTETAALVACTMVALVNT